jgi:multicomponent K+:H+ antiporter subunit A
VALVGGGLVYYGRRPLFAFQARHEGAVDARRLFDQAHDGTVRLAARLTRLIDTGSLQRQALLFVIGVVILGAAGLGLDDAPLTGSRALLPVDGVSLAAGLALIAAALATTWLHHERLTALILIGAVGLVVALTFVKFSAPDLAMTQLSVEVVTIVLLMLALYFLPQQGRWDHGSGRRLRDVVIAAAAGLGAMAMTWAVLTRPLESISGYFIDNSVPGGGGTNVVNVILVDFRGYDTFGEITVLALAALGIYALLDGLRLRAPDRDETGRLWDPDVHPLILSTFARVLLPLALLVSVFILLRGHNLPGGGFIAGLVTAVAMIMQYLANGVAWTQSRLPANTHPVIAAGLAIAVATGLASWLLGYPFLTSTVGHLHLPLIGDLHLASAMAFDLGVYLVVVGATLLILINLGLVHSAGHDLEARKTR